MREAEQILIADDDARLRDLLCEYLGGQGFIVIAAGDAAQARQALNYLSVDALILDRMMPGEDGVSLARALAKDDAAPPVLMLTAMGGTGERIEGLEAGVQDYLAKPFEPKELVLRLRNILTRRREAQAAQPQEAGQRFGPYRFDVNAQQLYRDGEPVYLTAAEACYLAALLRKAGQTVTRDALADELQSGSGRSVDVQINRLRKKIEANAARPVYIQTVRGEGYVINGVY